jgi:hypothetical protein
MLDQRALIPPLWAPHFAQKDAVGPLGGPPSRVGDGADATVILDRTNPNHAAANRYARRILSIDLPLASSSTNDRCHLFVWTKTADQILKKANRSTTSNTDH